MSDRIIPTLSISCGALTMLYIGLVVTTIFFASWETEAMSSVRNSEGQIGNLEASYYAALSKASTLSPSSLGFVAPTQVEYVAAAPENVSAGLSFAGN